MIRTEFINTLFKLVTILRSSGEYIFSQFHLNIRTYSVMCMIDSGINTSKKLLSGTYGSRPNLTKKIRMLEKQGFIMREVSQEDKRIWIFSLTKEGQDVLRAVHPVYQNAVSEVFSHIPEMDLQIAQKVLIRMIVDLEASLR